MRRDLHGPIFLMNCVMPLAVLRGELEAIQDGVRKFTPETVASLLYEAGTLTKLVIDDLISCRCLMKALAYQKAPVI